MPAPDPIIDLDELLTLVRQAWTDRYARGRILHVHKNAIRMPNGSILHLRVLVQQISEAEAVNHYQEDNQGDNL